MAREKTPSKTPSRRKSGADQDGKVSSKKSGVKRSARKDFGEERDYVKPEDIKDERFKGVQFDARFARDTKDDHKVKIDSRFKQIFEDEDFTTSGPKVDKYGRKVEAKDRARGADLKRYYKLESDDEDEDDDDDESEVDELEAKVDKKSKKKAATPSGKPNGKSKKDDKSSEDRLDYLTKLARGEISDVEESESESDDDLLAAEDEELLAQAAEEEEVEEIPLGDATSRIAVQNVDWSRMRAQDILVALQSFLPVGGVIKSVTVYMSEFGEKRMAEEETHGPCVGSIERQEVSLSDPTDFEILRRGEANEGDNFDMQKLRKYELDKLKYYFAIVDFNSAEVADHVYKECDGVEFERSSSVFDLRFVPEDLEIERPVRDAATEITEDYQAPEFVTKALQSTKVTLTWDEEDQDRMKLKKWRAKPQKGKEQHVIGEKELEAFIASESEEESEGEGEGDELDERGNAKAYRASLRAALLADDDDDEENDDDDNGDDEGEGQEMTFIPKDDSKESKNKKNSKKSINKQQDVPEDKEANPEAPTLHDTFFASKSSKRNKNKNRHQENDDKRWRRRNDDDDDDDEGSDIDEDTRRKREQAELELLLLNEQDRKKGRGLEGFDFKTIVEGERLLQKNSKLRGKKRDRKEEAVRAAKADTFEVDTKDSRFANLYNDPDFTIDRTNSHYKETRGMRAFEQEQLRKRGARKAEGRRSNAPNSSNAGANQSQNLQSTVESIKRRAAQMQNKNKRQKK